MSSVAFYTLGCKVNQYETEAVSEMFVKKGFRVVEFTDYADVYVINTCTVTGMSDRKSRQIIRRARKMNSDAIIAVMGCYAQTSPDDIIKIDGVNLVIGTKDKGKIVDEVLNIKPDMKKSTVSDISKYHNFESMEITKYSDMTRAYVKVQEGCNQFCTYCIIPYARGPIRSRKPEEVIEEVEKLIADGFSEIILVGIHIASYGLDLKNISFSDLINMINNVEGLRRLRLSSIEPMTLNEEFINSIKECDKLCPHFHLSLQSGCDATLKRMNRKYTTVEYRKIVNAIRNHFENPAITTDIMVGFPGETDEEFEESAKFFDEIKFADSHIFQYSRRKGTPAADYNCQIDPRVKEERSKILEKISLVNQNEYLLSQVAKAVTVLFEQRYHKDKKYFVGKTDNYVNVCVKTDKDLSGQYKTVLLESVKDGVVFGNIVE